MALADCQKAVGQVFNVGAVEEITIQGLAQTVLSLTQQKAGVPAGEANAERINYIPYDQAYAVGFEDMRQRVPDISKIREYTGWTPGHNLEDALIDVLEDQMHQGKNTSIDR
jgi:UDP-glucose 4-epimerase